MPKKFNAKKIKGKAELHPTSRKSAQLKRTLLRADRLTTKKIERAHAKASPIVDRLSWFQLILDDDQKSLTEEEMHELVFLYISRFDEEISSITDQLRPGRPIPKRLDELKMAKQGEQQEYGSTGFSLPDLRDPRNVQALRSWNGDYNGINVIKQIRLVEPKEVTAKPTSATMIMDIE